MSVLYDIEFKAIPNDFNKHKITTFLRMQNDKTYLCNRFNSIYKISYEKNIINKKIEFKENEFELIDYSMGYDESSPNATSYYVAVFKLPQPNKADIPNVFSPAYFVPYCYEGNDTIKVFDLYIAEIGTMFKTNCIGMMKDGNHSNFGSLKDTYYETAKTVLEIACGKLELTSIKI